MKSTIRVDFDRTNNNAPVITIAKEWSEDVRDEMIYDFISLLGHESKWLKIETTHEINRRTFFKVSAINPKDLRQEAAEMIKMADEMEARKQ